MPEKSTIEEKKEFLRREDIRTMEKDLLRLKEEQAGKERKRIWGLRTEAEVKKEEKEKKKEIIKEGKRRGVEPPIKEAGRKREIRRHEEKEEKKLVEEIERKWLQEKERREKEEAEKKKEIKERVLTREKEKQNLEKEKAQIEVSLQEFPFKKRPLQDKKRILLKKIEQSKIELQPILEKEREVEEKKRRIESEERRAVSSEARRKAEKERWQAEQKREEIEKKKWATEESIEKTAKEVKEAESEIEVIDQEEKSLRKRQEEIIKREGQIALEEEKAKLEEKLVEIQKEKAPLEKELDELFGKKRGFEESLARIVQDEKSIEEEIKIIEEREAKTPLVEERRTIEKERWGAEKERTEIEKDRWNIEEEKNKAELLIKEFNLKNQRVKNKEERLRKRIKEIENILSGEEKIEFRKEGPPSREEASREEIKEQKIPTKEELTDEELIRKAQERLEKIREREGFAAPEEPSEKEKFSPIPKIEEEPVLTPEETKEERPATEPLMEEAEEIEGEGPIMEPERKIPVPVPPPPIELTEETKKSILDPIKKIIPLIRKEGVKKKEKEKFISIPEREGKRMAGRKIKTEEMRKEEEEERKRFLERIETGKEKRVDLMGKEGGKPLRSTRHPSVVLRPLPKRSSSFEKIFIRILFLVLFLIISIGGLFIGYSILVKKPSSPPAETSPPPEEILPEEVPLEEAPPEEEFPVPPSPFSVGETKTFEVFEIDEVSSRIEQILELSLPPEEFTRIVFRSAKSNKLITLADFFSAFKVEPPKDLDFYSKITNNEVFFIWPQKEGRRLGFLVEIKEKEALENLLRLWEPQMEENFKELFTLLGKKEPAIRDYFADLKHKGISSRCQTFTVNDLGICYLITDQYLIFTSSFQSMTKIIDDLYKTEEAEEVE